MALTPSFDGVAVKLSREALRHAASIVEARVSPEAAAVFRCAYHAVMVREATIPAFWKSISDEKVLGGDDSRLAARIDDASDAFRQSFGIGLVSLVSDDTKNDALTRRPGGKFAAVCRHRWPSSSLTAGGPTPDRATAQWASLVVEAARSTPAGFALECRGASARERASELSFFASVVEASGGKPLIVSGAVIELADLLFAEAVALATKRIVCVDADIAQTIEIDDLSDPAAKSMQITSFGVEVSHLVPHLRATYVWRVGGSVACLPGDAKAVLPMVPIGPTGFDPAWSAALLAQFVPDIGPQGTNAVLSRYRDPRGALPVVRIATSAAKAWCVTLDSALVQLLKGTPTIPGNACIPARASFDLRLFQSDHDVTDLWDCAPALASNGARILLAGPPGGGKTAFARALVARMGVPLVTLEAASFIRWRWGETERALADVFAEATAQGAAILIDEFEGFGGQRSGETTGNATLVMTLTNEILRRFDDANALPVLATTNFLTSVDAALRRRFHWTITVRDELSPEGEQLAWKVVLGLVPPPGWTPCGAAVADYRVTAERLMMLGRREAKFAATEIVKARDARCGVSRAAVFGFVDRAR